MVQQGQTIELTRRGADGMPLWAYRYRTGGRDSKRVQRGGFASEQDARDALERELERVRRERRISRSLTLAELVVVRIPVLAAPSLGLLLSGVDPLPAQSSTAEALTALTPRSRSARCA